MLRFDVCALQQTYIRPLAPVRTAAEQGYDAVMVSVIRALRSLRMAGFAHGRNSSSPISASGRFRRIGQALHLTFRIQILRGTFTDVNAPVRGRVCKRNRRPAFPTPTENQNIWLETGSALLLRQTPSRRALRVGTVQ